MSNKKLLNVSFILIGIVCLLFSRHYSGISEGFFSSFGANMSFAFILYFLLKFFDLPWIENRFVNVFYAFLFISLQEFVQWVNMYPGTYDRLDFLFNGIGANFGMLVELLVSRFVKFKK